MRLIHIAITVLFFSFCSSSYSQEMKVDPEITKIVIMRLISVANMPLPKSCETCVNQFEKDKKVTINDIISTALAYLYNGDNRIIGSIETKNGMERCSLSIYHDLEEDVYSYQFIFDYKNGKVQLSSMICASTP